MMHSMKKRLLAGLMTVMILLSNVMPVYAATTEESLTKAPATETATVQEPVAKTTPEELPNRNVNFYAYVNGELTLIETREITAYWIGGRQCIDATTLESVYGKLGFKAADLTAGGKMFLHTDLNQGLIWAEAAKTLNGVVYAAAINHKEDTQQGDPGNRFDLFYLPEQTVQGYTSREDAATVAEETFYTVTDEAGNQKYYFNGTDVEIVRDATSKDWTCVGKDGTQVDGVVENGTVTFTIPAISQAYTLTATDKPVPQPVALTAKVNGTDVSGASLSNIITQSGVAAKDVKTLEFVSGKLTKADRDYIERELKWMTTMTLRVSNTMQLLDNNGTPTTILGGQTASFNFGKPDGWSKGGLRTLNLAGITEVQKNAIDSGSVETINLPDVVTVGDRALVSFDFLETLNLPKAKTVGEFAFMSNLRLENLTLNAVETLGEGSFKYTDELTKLTLPETIKSIADIGFDFARNGNKSGTVITIKATTPPTVEGAPFDRLGSYYNPPLLVVPQGALEAYIHAEHPEADLTKFLESVTWNDLHVREEGRHVIEYYNSERSWDTTYAYVQAGETVKADQIPTAKAAQGKMFKGWNTDRNGQGVWVNEQLVPAELPRYSNQPDGPRYPFTSAIQVYAIFGKAVNLTAKVNGVEFSGTSLSEIITQSGVAAEDVDTLEFVSGKLTKADRDYIESDLKWMTTMTLCVSDTMQLLDNNGTPTTVLGEQTASFNFGTPDGSSKGNLETLNLSGITEVQRKAIKSNSVETINLPDVVTVGDSALTSFDYLETLNLPKAKTVGEFAFMSNLRLENLTLNAVETLGEGSFKYTDSLRELTLPETIREIGNIEFGIVRQGNKSGTVITIKAMTPPTVKRGAFKGVSSMTREALVVVPQGALAAYVHQKYPNADVTGLLNKDQAQWNDLYLREEGSFTIKYYNSAKSWETKYAYVKDGKAVTDAQIPTFAEKDTELFLGWNTQKNGTGDMIVPGFVPTKHMTVSPIVVKAVTITVDLGDTTQTIKVEKGKAIGEKMPAAPEKDENHDFAGWVDENGNVVTAETVAQENMTIHPTWFEDFNHNDIDDATEPRYTVIYTDAGQHPADPVFEAKMFENILVGMPTPSFGEVPVREGEVFAGWAPQVFDTVTSDMLYTAIWYKDENNNGIPDKDEDRFCVTYTDGVDGAAFENRVFGDLLTGVKTPEFTGEIEREGYVFAGWTPEVAETVTDNALYTATWKEDRNNNGIADDVDTYHEVIITDGMDGELFTSIHLQILTGTKLVGLNPAPEFEGYVFKGWKDQDGNAVTSDTVVTGDLVVTAQVGKLFNVTFEADGIEVTVQVEDGEALGDMMPADPEKEGYTFKRWKDQDGNVVTAETVVTGDMTVSAVFEKNAVPEKPVDPEVPATGDSAHVMGWMMLAVLAMFGTALTIQKRRQYK